MAQREMRSLSSLLTSSSSTTTTGESFGTMLLDGDSDISMIRRLDERNKVNWSLNRSELVTLAEYQECQKGVGGSELWHVHLYVIKCVETSVVLT